MAAAVLLFGAVMLSAQNLPDVQVENMSGEQVRIRDVVAGKPAIISFWGVTCKPCITELNTLNALMDEWLEQVDFDIIAVSVDDTRFLARAKSMVQGYEEGHERVPHAADIHRGCRGQDSVFAFRIHSGKRTGAFGQADRDIRGLIVLKRLLHAQRRFQFHMKLELPFLFAIFEGC